MFRFLQNHLKANINHREVHSVCTYIMRSHSAMGSHNVCTHWWYLPMVNLLKRETYCMYQQLFLRNHLKAIVNHREVHSVCTYIMRSHSAMGSHNVCTHWWYLLMVNLLKRETYCMYQQLFYKTILRPLLTIGRYHQCVHTLWDPIVIWDPIMYIHTECTSLWLTY